VKIGQYLAKVWTNLYDSSLFGGHPIETEQFVVYRLQLASYVTELYDTPPRLQETVAMPKIHYTSFPVARP